MKIYFHTFGCKVNQYETQLLREQLTDSTYTSTDNFLNANIAIINSCTVTQNADADCRQIVRKLLRQNLSCRIIVTGCYAV
ncbi:MAG: tRNA (N(6)-L-threonylcarbamoyladenosine(37)-C(2))-methylthiotransferase MtaB, partial [Elusimicrobiota bacterium]|nr:tRNA (N(6)-L-threonylcarbamoyladenosine(37)-C(2))-methylthiotransferase MtaB [Elusimicrobiota bacterium]